MTATSITIGERADTERQILELSEAWSKAIVANDADEIGKYMFDDWLMVSERGVSTKEHFLSFVRSGALTHSSMTVAEFHSIKVFGDTAILVARVTNTAHFGGETFNANEWTTDVYLRRNGEWRCVLTHITEAQPQAMTMD